MKHVIKSHVQSYFKAPLFSIGLWPLFLFAIFTSGCFNNSNNSIQTTASREHTPLVAPISASINKYETENKTNINNSNVPYNNPISIKAKQSQPNVHPILTNETLLLGNSRIDNWPLGLPVCKQCRLDITRNFHPDGPDTLVVLNHNKTSYQWGIFQSGQKQSHLLDAKLYLDGQGKLNMTKINSDENTVLQMGQIYRLKNCRINPLWIESITSLSSAYSDDQAKHKIQIFFECQ